MKIANLMCLSILVTLAAAGCGKYDKDPVSSKEGNVSLEDLRQHNTGEINRGPEKPREITNQVVIKEPVEVIREVVRTEYVTVEVTKEQASVDDKFLVITPDSDMNFIEGKQASFKVRARVLIPGVKIKLTAQNLPEGAKLENVSTETEKDLYSLTWTPSLYTVSGNEATKSFKVKLVAQVSEAQNEKDKKALEGLVREKEVSLLVLKDQTPPSELAIESLAATVTEGTQTSFQVTVKVPGIDGKSPQKPRLVISYDGVSYTAGNSFLELDGSRYIVADMNKKDAEYLGNSKWRFHVIFDTKNISVQPQLAKDGTVMTKSDGTRVRFSVKAYSPFGSSTPEALRQVKIALNKTMSAPRFDLSALGQGALEVSQGESLRLAFYVESMDASSDVKVEVPNLSTIVGSPKIQCQASAKGASQQICTLRWTIPCEAQDKDLQQDIALSAQSSSNGQNSEVVKYSLKVVKSKTVSGLCKSSTGVGQTTQEQGK